MNFETPLELCAVPLGSQTKLATALGPIKKIGTRVTQTIGSMRTKGELWKCRGNVTIFA